MHAKAFIKNYIGRYQNPPCQNNDKCLDFISLNQNRTMKYYNSYHILDGVTRF